MSAASPKPVKPLEPVQITARFVGGATRRDVLAGAAVLEIESGDATDRDVQPYWVRARYDGEVCLGFELRKFGTGEVYDVPRSLDRCTCPDATYRPQRPGGCRHQAALRQALPTVARPARVPERTARDEHYVPEPAEAGDEAA